MKTFETTNFDAEITAYAIAGSTTLHIYSRNHNFVRVQRKEDSELTSVYVKIGDYEGFEFALDNNGRGVIDVSSLIRVHETHSVQIVIDDVTMTANVYEGINPDDFLTLTGRGTYECAGGTAMNAFLPDTMLQGVGLKFPAWQVVSTTITGATYTYSEVEISENIISVGGVYNYKLKQLADDRRYCYLTWKSPYARRHGTGVILSAPYGRALFEVESVKLDTNAQELQVEGDGYKAEIDTTAQMTLILRGCTGYDVAYYSQILMSDEIEIEGVGGVVPVTKSIDMQMASSQKVDIKMTFKIKHYDAV